MTGNTPQTDKTAQRRQAAQALAVVGAVFTLVFLGLLIVNGYRQYGAGARQEALLTAEKQRLLQVPDNETLIDEIRERDRDYRTGKFRALDFTGLGGLMLLVSAVVTFGALRWLSHLKGISPEPVPNTEEPYRRRRQGAGRMALAGGAILLTAAAMLLEQRVPSGWLARVGTGAGASADADYASPEQLAENWNRFRGFAGAGVVPYDDIPTRWDGTGGSGILWKTPIPLPGHNSPVVWQDRVFLSGASWEKREVYCFDAESGAILWTGEVPTAHMGDRWPDVMEDTGLAASTMATDGVRIYALFATGDLAAFDFGGRRLWHNNLGIPDNTYGHATSLEVWQDRVLVQYDQGFVDDGKSRLYAFDGRTGGLLWEVKRPVAKSWTSPIVARVGDDYQFITVSTPWVIAYDPNDGKEIWRANCVDGEAAASPIVSGGLVIAVYPNHETVAIRSGASGDLTDTGVAWRNEDIAPEIVSPAADDHRVFLLDSYGTLYAVNGLDGKLLYEHDFEENVKSSPTLVAGRLYVLSIFGTMFIGTPGDTEFTLEATNYLEEACYASPAFMDGRIYIRGESHLYCIGNEAN